MFLIFNGRVQKKNFYGGLFFILCAFFVSFEDYYMPFSSGRNKTEALSENPSVTKENDVQTFSSEGDGMSPIRISVKSGQSLSQVLKANHFSDKMISKFSAAIASASPGFTLKPSHNIYLTGTFSEEIVSFKEMKIRTDPDAELIITKENEEEFKAIIHKIKLVKKNKYISGVLDTNFYSALKGKGISPKIIKTAAVNLGYVVNFQHDIKKGDGYRFLYEVYVDPEGVEVKYGNILFMSLEVKGKSYDLYGFSRQKKSFEYFSKTGESVVRGFLQTPLDVRRVRISSGFTLKGRMHPIRGYCRAHKGVDFAASIGTPVISAADGVVIQAGYSGGYGNKVVVQHASGYKTVYGHLHKIKVRRGERVKQRQLLGTVGTTGESTGPHLHFELLTYDKHINPLSFKLLPAEKLSGADLNGFNRYVSGIQQELSEVEHTEAKVRKTLEA